MLYTLNFYSDIYQLYLNETGGILINEPSQKKRIVFRKKRIQETEERL